MLITTIIDMNNTQPSPSSSTPENSRQGYSVRLWSTNRFRYQTEERASLPIVTRLSTEIARTQL